MKETIKIEGRKFQVTFTHDAKCSKGYLYYCFWLEGKRHRGSTKEKSKLYRRHTGYPNMDGLAANDAVDGIPLTRVYTRGPGKIGALLYLLNGRVADAPGAPPR